MMGMNEFDIGVVVFIGLSGLFALARGFVKEVLSIVAWFGASLAALYAFPYLRPLAIKVTPTPGVADAAASLFAFVLALVILSLLTAAVARRVKDSPVSAIDRTLGLLFGLLRGALLACLIYIALSAVLPALGPLPPWFVQARSRPMLAEGVNSLRQLAPRSIHDPSSGQTVEQALQNAIRAFSVPKPSATPTDTTAPNYSPEEQRGMDRLFQQNQSGH